MNPARRRRKPRTTVGKVIRAWPWIRVGLRVVRFVARAPRTIAFALLAGAAAAVVAVVRRVRRRRDVIVQTYAPPPATTAAWSGGTRETGYEAGPGTQTERHLEAVKGEDDGGKSPTFDVDAANESAAGQDVPPPVEEEPPTKT